MDTDGVLQADAEVDSLAVAKDSRRAKASSYGTDTTTIAEGAIAGNANLRARDSDENTPLLGRDTETSPASEQRRGNDGYKSPGWEGQSDFDGLPWWQRPSIFWMLGPFLIHALAFGGLAVPRLNLFLSLICREVLSDRSINDPTFSSMPIDWTGENDQCRIPEVQSKVAQFTLYGNLISGILSAITSPKLGALSDRYGRKRIIVVTNMGMLVGEVIMIFAAIYPDTFNVNWVLLGYAFDGICGSFVAAMALAHSYASDCTPPERRNVAFGYFHGCLFTGIAAGPILSGLLVKAAGQILVIFYIAIGCHLFFILFVLFVVPESLSQRRQIAAREKHRIEQEEIGPTSEWAQRDWINVIRSFNTLQPLKILYPIGPGSNRLVRRNLVLLAATDTIIFGVAMGVITVIIIYSEYAFGWGNYESSIFVSIVNTCRVLNLLLVLPLITHLVRGRQPQKSTGADNFDLYTIRVAVLFDTLGFLGYTLSRTGTMLTFSGAIASVGGMGSPTLQSALTKHVPPEKTGQLLGASGLLHALARVVAPTICNAIYVATVATFPQTIFVCLTATFSVAFLLSWFIKPHVHYDEIEAPSETNEDGRSEEPSPDT